MKDLWLSLRALMTEIIPLDEGELAFSRCSQLIKRKDVNGITNIILLRLTVLEKICRDLYLSSNKHLA